VIGLVEDWKKMTGEEGEGKISIRNNTSGTGFDRRGKAHTQPPSGGGPLGKR